MAIFKCKMCGGALEITENQTVCECEYCGSQQTLPKLSDDTKANMYDRANHFRRNNEYDKAMGIYEQILNEDNTDAEAYWSLVLCRYGIEYVEDPATHKRVPTINRAQYTSIFDDDNYKSALANADESQKSVYEEEAKAINEIQKGILEISQKEEPFDVFICYKETDNNGRRTQDSVLATDLFHQLTQEGLKVFFARITLEDKLGSAYEPYIFAALNSAKVMVVLGTNSDYFKAVWVRNEWSRFLALVKQSKGKKMLIPAYRDMDPYDLPEEFSHLQAQDMSKLGFMQDLIRGVKKIIGAESEKRNDPQSVDNTGTQQLPANVQALLDRGEMALEDNEWDKADSFFEEVLNQNAKCAEAYLGKLFAKMHVANHKTLVDYFKEKYSEARKEKLFACDEENDYINANCKKNEVEGYLTQEDIKKVYQYDRSYMSALSCREEQKREGLERFQSEKLFIRAKQYASGETLSALEDDEKAMEKIFDERIQEAKGEDAASIAAVKAAYANFVREADAKVEKLRVDAEEKREYTYLSRIKEFENAKDTYDYQTLKTKFQAMYGFKESVDYIHKCDEEIDRIRKERESEEIKRKEAAAKKAKKHKRITIISILLVIATIAVSFLIKNVIIPEKKYKDAIALMNSGRYEEAIAAFEELDGYKDSMNQIDNCHIVINDGIYDNAVTLMNSGNYIEAYELFETLNGFKDSEELKKSTYADYEWEIIKASDIRDIVQFGNYNGNTEWIVLAKENGKILLVSKYAIEEKSYNATFVSVAWESCTLRSWLNGTYITSAFSGDEQALIMSTNVVNSDNAYGTSGGNNTTDKVFLLSIDEVNKYFTSDSDRQVTLADGTSVWWWLRSPGSSSTLAARVSGDGSVYGSGYSVGTEGGAVRPALWIDISNH